MNPDLSVSALCSSELIRGDTEKHFCSTFDAEYILITLFHSPLLLNRTDDGLEVKIHLILVHLSTDKADFTMYHMIVLLLNDFT